MNPNTDRNAELERLVLGGIMLDHTLMNEVVAQELTKDTLVSPFHRNLWDLYIEMSKESRNIDLPNVIATAMAKGQTEKFGGVGYLAALPNACPSTYGVMGAVRLLKNLETRRATRLLGIKMTELAANAGVNGEELVQKVQELARSIPTERKDEWKDSSHITGVLQQVADQQAARIRGENVGLSTGIESLDFMIGGWLPGRVYVVGARPGMGKSAFAQQQHSLAGMMANVGSAFISLEMGTDECILRALIQESGINAASVRDANISASDWEMLDIARERVVTPALRWAYKPGLRIDGLRAMLDRCKSELAAKGYPLKLVILDYAQLMQSTNPRQPRHEFMADVSRMFKLLAGELEFAFMVLVQLNREVTNRTDKKPTMADIRESGAFEQDADVILLLHRPEYYDASEEPGVAHIIVAKARNGRTGFVRVEWDGRSVSFGREVSG